MQVTDAGGAPVDRPVRPGSEARWYCLDRDGVAMLCKDEADARAQVIENSDCWPNRAPYRAALLGDVKALEAESAALRREAHTWSKAAETYAASEAKLADALTELVALEDMRVRLRQLHEMGHGTDYYDYHRRLPLAWDAARKILGPNGADTGPL